MTSEFFLALGKANLAAAAAILAVIVLRKPVRAMFGARLAYLFWLVVPAAALAVLIPARTLVMSVTEPDASATDAVASVVGAIDAGSPVLAAWDPWLVLFCIWLAGAVATAAWFARNQLAFLADERRGRAGPAVVGVLRPRIALPANFAELFDDRQRAVILEHETAHIARHDAGANGLAALAQCVCWFNPLVHIGARMMRIDQEMACDAQVIEQHPNFRRTYAEAMLKAELAGRSLPLGCYWPQGADHPLTTRVAMLKHEKPGRLRRMAGAIFLVALASGAALSAWASQPQRVEYVAAVVSPALPDTTSGPADMSGVTREEAPRASQSTPRSHDASPKGSPVPQDKPKQVLPAYAPFGAAGGANGKFKSVTLKGMVTDVHWVNPSVQIYLRDDSGKDWYVLSMTVNNMQRYGATRDNLRKGARITLIGRQAIDMPCEPLCVAIAKAETMTIDGVQLVRSALALPDDEPQPQQASSPQVQPQQPPVIRDIIIEGNQRVEASVIRSQLLLKPGDTPDIDRVRASMRALFATGQFADVQIVKRDADLVVKVIERAVEPQPTPPPPQGALTMPGVPLQREIRDARFTGLDGSGQPYTLTAERVWRSGNAGVIEFIKPLMVTGASTISAEKAVLDEGERMIAFKDGLIRQNSSGDVRYFVQMPVMLALKSPQ